MFGVPVGSAVIHEAAVAYFAAPSVDHLGISPLEDSVGDAWCWVNCSLSVASPGQFVGTDTFDIVAVEVADGVAFCLVDVEVSESQ